MRWADARLLEIGYQAFNLYAFAMLKKHLPDHAIWNSFALTKALKYVESTEFLRGIEENPFAYPYNPCGLEVAFAVQEFPTVYSNPIVLRSGWIRRQFEHNLDSETGLLVTNTSDPTVLAARLYEATRLDDLDLTDIPLAKPLV